MKILHCLKLSLNAFLEMLEKTFCYYDFKKEKETKDDFFKVNPAKTVEEELLEKIKFALRCNNEAQAIRMLEQYKYYIQNKHENNN